MQKLLIEKTELIVKEKMEVAFGSQISFKLKSQFVLVLLNIFKGL